MEENYEKHFHSTSDSSTKSINKDQISVYKKKNNIVLHLGSKTTTSSDQTPTPTRFIRNCEEVGLFQDLQNVNPFEETFRKAAEAAKNGIITSLQVSSVGGNVPSNGVDDTLHTPHVFPHIIENESGQLHSNQSLSSNKLKTVIEECNNSSSDIVITNEQQSEEIICIEERHQKNNSVVVKQEADISQKFIKYNKHLIPPASEIRPIASAPLEASAETNSNSNQSQNPVQVLLRIPDGRLVQLSVIQIEDDDNSKEQKSDSGTVEKEAELKSTSGDTVLLTTGDYVESTKTNFMPNTKSSSSVTKQKLKQALLGNMCPATSMHSIEQKPQTQVPEQTKVPISRKNEFVMERQPVRRNSSIISSEDEEEDKKRKKVLERNRIAAMRCREKRKSWVASLEKRAEQMGNTNQQLQLEVASLRAEVAQLKTLLLAHKDCPVTQAMAQGTIENPLVPSTTQVFNVTLPVQQNKSLSDRSALQQNTVILLNPPNMSKKRVQPSENANSHQVVKRKLQGNPGRRSTCFPRSNNQKQKVSTERIGLNLERACDFQTGGKRNDNSQQFITLHTINIAENDMVEEDSNLNSINPVSKKISKPVATQVIQVNPNAVNLNRENIALRLPTDNDMQGIQVQPIVTTAYR